MKQEKSFVYTLILGTCMIISLLLVGKMLLYRSIPIHAPHMSQMEMQEEEKPVYLSENDLTERLMKQLPQDFPVRNPVLAISRNGTIRAHGTLQREALRGIEALRFSLMWLPKEFSLQIDFRAECKGSELVLAPRGIQAAGFSVSAEQVPAEWAEILNAAVHTALRENGEQFTRIQLLNGGLQLLA